MELKDWPISRMSTQEAFEYIGTHLIRQGKRSADFNNSCFYRMYSTGDDGQPTVLKCAGGIAIPDEAYHEGMEQNEWQRLVRKGRVPKEHTDMIVALQLVHDNEDPLGWIEALRREARRFRLDAAWIDALVTQ